MGLLKEAIMWCQSVVFNSMSECFVTLSKLVGGTAPETFVVSHVLLFITIFPGVQVTHNDCQYFI